MKYEFNHWENKQFQVIMNESNINVTSVLILKALNLQTKVSSWWFLFSLYFWTIKELNLVILPHNLFKCEQCHNEKHLQNTHKHFGSRFKCNQWVWPNRNCRTLPSNHPEADCSIFTLMSVGWSSSSLFVTINSTSIKPSIKVRNLTYYIFGESLWCWQPLGTC